MSDPTKQWLIEITRTGGWLRVAVLDPATGREAVAHGPLNANEEDLLRLALNRLRRPEDPHPRDGLVV